MWCGKKVFVFMFVCELSRKFVFFFFFLKSVLYSRCIFVVFHWFKRAESYNSSPKTLRYFVRVWDLKVLHVSAFYNSGMRMTREFRWVTVLESLSCVRYRSRTMRV